jgi:hypothetical protein
MSLETHFMHLPFVDGVLLEEKHMNEIVDAINEAIDYRTKAIAKPKSCGQSSVGD